jgi:probable F420-dependent oxidoreductase
MPQEIDVSGVKFSVRIPVCSPVTRRDRMLEATREAEALGYDAVFVQDHIHKSFEKHRSSPPGCGSVNEPGNTLEPVMFEMVTTLAFLAGSTRTIELGVGVVPLPFREPIVLAKQLASLDALSEGRLIVGVGVANVTDKPEFEALGVPFLPYAERYELAGEYVAAMRAIWREPTASFHGKHVNFDGLTVFPKPVRTIPILLGAGSLAGGLDRPPVKFALSHADGVMPMYTTSSASFAASVRDFSETARAAGKDMTSFDWCAQRRFSIGETREEAWANVAWMESEQADMWQYAGYMHAMGEAGTRTNTQRAGIGTRDDIRASIDEYLTAGANHIEVAFIYPHHEAMLRQMRLFADTVMPAYR